MQSLPWSLRNAVRALSVACGTLNLLLGIIVSLTFSAKCLIAGIIMIMLGGIILAIEATFLCGLFAFGQSARGIADFFERKPIWIRCVFYTATAMIPLLLCHDPFVLLAFMSSIACSATCFVIAISKRGSSNRHSQVSGGPVVITTGNGSGGNLTQ
ncbi:hypothetical protein ACOME3_009830 [Neoechinorhynchus agilis]